MRTWRRRKDTLGVFSIYAKRHKSVYIFVNNNTNVKIFWILSIYTIWDGLSQKTISRYCPFKEGGGDRSNGVNGLGEEEKEHWEMGGELVTQGSIG